MEAEVLLPRESSIERLVAGGKSFAEESRVYLEKIWDVPVYNTYGSTEGTTCGECYEKVALHVPADLVHLMSTILNLKISWMKGNVEE